jgi:hypothetical protein
MACSPCRRSRALLAVYPSRGNRLRGLAASCGRAARNLIRGRDRLVPSSYAPGSSTAVGRTGAEPVTLGLKVLHFKAFQQQHANSKKRRFQASAQAVSARARRSFLPVSCLHTGHRRSIAGEMERSCRFGVVAVGALMVRLSARWNPGVALPHQAATTHLTSCRRGRGSRSGVTRVSSWSPSTDPGESRCGASRVGSDGGLRLGSSATRCDPTLRRPPFVAPSTGPPPVS